MHKILDVYEATVEIPTLVIVGGDVEDKYAKTPQLKIWIRTQQKQKDSKMVAVECPGGYHELDSEPNHMGGQVRLAATNFVRQVLKGKASELSFGDGKCRNFH